MGAAAAPAVPTPVGNLPPAFSPFGPPRRAPPRPLAKKSSPRPSRKRIITRTVIHPDAAGIVLVSAVHASAVPADRDPRPSRNFGPTTVRWRVMAGWLQEGGVRTVAAEATVGYRVPLFGVTEARAPAVCPGNAQLVRHGPGRKREVQDSQRLRHRDRRVPVDAVGRGRQRRRPRTGAQPLPHARDPHRLRSQPTRPSRPPPPPQSALAAHAGDPPRFRAPTRRCRRGCSAAGVSARPPPDPSPPSDSQ